METNRFYQPSSCYLVKFVSPFIRVYPWFSCRSRLQNPIGLRQYPPNLFESIAKARTTDR